MGPKIVVVVGARPQFVKHAALDRHLREFSKLVLVHTGQHYDPEMSDSFFAQLDLGQPAYNLGVGSGSHGVQTAAILRETESVLIKEKPDLLLVYGDTNSTVAAALAAVKLHIPIAHVEAGVRNFDLRIPEEVNRVLTDRMSDMLFCPTKTAVENLRVENLVDRSYLTGDVMLDVFLESEATAKEVAKSKLNEMGLVPGDYLLLTLHRPSNVDDPLLLERTLEALQGMGRTVVFPAHPRTRNVLRQSGLESRLLSWSNFRLIPPQDYLSFLALGRYSSGIITDSGGVQKEAYFLGVPCTTLFDNTPWPETLEFGWNALCGHDTALMTASVGRSRPLGVRGTAFGDGTAGKQTARLIASRLGMARD